MLALAADAIAHVLDGGLADGEGSVAVLPTKMLQLGPLLLQPEIGTGFELAHDIAERLGAGGEEQEMHRAGSEWISTAVHPRSRRMPPR